MTSLVPLHGTELIDCAEANANQGIAVAAHQCGYGDDIAAFERELRVAAEQMGIKVRGFQDLIKIVEVGRVRGIEIAPDSETKL